MTTPTHSASHPTARFGIIAGTGYYELPGLQASSETQVENIWGVATIRTGTWHGQPIAFLPRHGGSHSIPPSAINYRANMKALEDCGVEAVLAVNVVGSMISDYGPGALMLLDDYLEFTSGRGYTYFDQVDEAGVTHIDMTEPYHPMVRSAVLAAAADEDIEIVPTGTYVCVNGPRFETPAEIRMYAQMGASVVGMTGYPEVALARELGIAYGAIAVVANLAAGMAAGAISHEEISGELEATKGPVFSLMGRTIELLSQR